MATRNQVDLGLSGSTGTGNFVGANTPTLITPVIGAATATSVVFNPTTGGIIGTTTNDNANAGSVGEFVSSVILLSGTPVVLSTGTPADLTSISLTAGDWDVFGNVSFLPLSAGTVISQVQNWISSTSATSPDPALVNSITAPATGAGTATAFNAPTMRFSLGSTTTIYISAVATFSVSGLEMIGAIYARRVR